MPASRAGCRGAARHVAELLVGISPRARGRDWRAAIGASRACAARSSSSIRVTGSAASARNLLAQRGRLDAVAARRLHAAQSRFRGAAARLDGLSPLAVLGRGYAVCWDGDRTRIVRDASTLAPGDAIRVTLERGELRARVSTADALTRCSRLETTRDTIEASPMDPTIKDFEAAIAELEGIVKKLEEGDLPLETSLELYERGVHAVALLPRPPRSRRAPHRSAERARRAQAGVSRAGPRSRRRGVGRRDPRRLPRPAPRGRRSRAGHGASRSARLSLRSSSTRCATACSAAASGCGRCWCSRRCEAVQARDGAAAARRRAARGVRRRDDPHLFADPRRPAGDGRRRPAPRPADLARRARRGHGDPRRRRPAGRGVRAARPVAGDATTRPCRRASCARCW